MLLNCRVGEDYWKSLGHKEIISVNPKGNQPWIFTGRTDAEAEAQYFDHLMQRANSGKDPDAGKDWRQEEKEVIEEEMVGWLCWLSGHKFEQASGVGEGLGSLACCSPWGHKKSDTTEWLNNGALRWSNLYMYYSNDVQWNCDVPYFQEHKSNAK